MVTLNWLSRFSPALVMVFGLLALAPTARAGDPPNPRSIRVVVWDERQPKQKPTYDNFLGNAIADYLKSRPGIEVKSIALAINSRLHSASSPSNGGSHCP